MLLYFIELYQKSSAEHLDYLRCSAEVFDFNIKLRQWKSDQPSNSGGVVVSAGVVCAGVVTAGEG